MANENMSTKPNMSVKQTASPQERMKEAAIKEMEKQTKAQTAARLQQGQTPEQILQSLSGAIEPQQAPVMDTTGLTQMLAQLVAQKTAPATTSDKLQAGLTILSGGMIPTPGYARIQDKRKNPLSVSDITGIMNIQNNMSEAARRKKADARRAPGVIAQGQSEILKFGQQLAQTTGDYSLINAIIEQSKQLNPAMQSQDPNQAPGIESDPAYDPAFRQEYVKQDMERTFTNRKELDTYTRSVAPVMKDLMKFQDIAEQLPNYKNGIVNQMIAKGDAVAKVIAADPVAVRFNAAIDAGLGNFVKSNGDSGTLSNQDLDRVKSVIGKTSIPFLDKVQVYNDMAEKYLTQLDTRKELAKDPNYDKRFPLIKAGRERYMKNKALLEASGRKQGGEEVPFTERLAAISKATGAKITYSEEGE